MADVENIAVTPDLLRGEHEVALFRKAMLRELQANAYKGDWHDILWTRRKHFYELDYHLAKLKAATKEGNPVRVLEFAADLANHAMFLADSEDALSVLVCMTRQAEPSFVKPGVSTYLRLLLNPRWARKGWGGLRNPVDREEHPEPGLIGG